VSRAFLLTGIVQILGKEIVCSKNELTGGFKMEENTVYIDRNENTIRIYTDSLANKFKKTVFITAEYKTQCYKDSYLTEPMVKYHLSFVPGFSEEKCSLKYFSTLDELLTECSGLLNESVSW
jgi:hypothetical protein